MRSLARALTYARFVGCLLVASGICAAQQTPNPSAARILLMPRKMVTGERATLAVLDVNGRLTPGVNVLFSYGEKVTTDVTGRAMFVAPLVPSTIHAIIEGRPGRVASMIVTPEQSPTATMVIAATPFAATLGDHFDLLGQGFCGDADANHVTIAGQPAVVLASSPAALTVLPSAEMEPGPAQVQVACRQKNAPAFTVVFVNLELQASGGSLAPGEHRALSVRVHGSTAKLHLEARNLAPDIAELTGGATVRVLSSGGASNFAQFELVGKKHGNFMVSIHLVAPLASPRP